MPQKCNICHKINCLNLKAKYCSSYNTNTKAHTLEIQANNLQPFNFLLHNYNLKNSASKNGSVILKIVIGLLLSLQLIFMLPAFIESTFFMDGIDNWDGCGYIPFWKFLPDDGDISFFYFLLFLLIVGSIFGLFIYFSKRRVLIRCLAI